MVVLNAPGKYQYDLRNHLLVNLFPIALDAAITTSNVNNHELHRNNIPATLSGNSGTVPVRSFNYVEEVKGPDHHKYLWTNASFAFAANMVRSFVTNGWCVQIRGPQAGGAVQDLPIHLYDLGTGNQVKIPSEVMIPETREFEFAKPPALPPV